MCVHVQEVAASGDADHTGRLPKLRNAFLHEALGYKSLTELIGEHNVIRKSFIGKSRADKRTMQDEAARAARALSPLPAPAPPLAADEVSALTRVV
jgi:hypothetical protein